jgi:hypothetical protein
MHPRHRSGFEPTTQQSAVRTSGPRQPTYKRIGVYVHMWVSNFYEFPTVLLEIGLIYGTVESEPHTELVPLQRSLTLTMYNIFPFLKTDFCHRRTMGTIELCPIKKVHTGIPTYMSNFIIMHGHCDYHLNLLLT